jgi:hypothetical protein
VLARYCSVQAYSRMFNGGATAAVEATPAPPAPVVTRCFQWWPPSEPTMMRFTPGRGKVSLLSRGRCCSCLPVVHQPWAEEGSPCTSVGKRAAGGLHKQTACIPELTLEIAKGRSSCLFYHGCSRHN